MQQRSQGKEKTPSRKWRVRSSYGVFCYSVVSSHVCEWFLGFWSFEAKTRPISCFKDQNAVLAVQGQNQAFWWLKALFGLIFWSLEAKIRPISCFKGQNAVLVVQGPNQVNFVFRQTKWLFRAFWWFKALFGLILCLNYQNGIFKRFGASKPFSG